LITPHQGESGSRSGNNVDRGGPHHVLQKPHIVWPTLGLLELRERAYQHIQKSLTVENIPFEVFSPFSATFAEVRKIQVNYFLEHWSEIRASDAMQNVWRQIRNGRHPGFEEVWPSIALHLEFNPRTGSLADAESPKT